MSVGIRAVPAHGSVDIRYPSSRVRSSDLGKAMSEKQCSKCGSTQLRWATMRKNVPFDLLQCQKCGHVLDQQDWMPPVLPLFPGRCINCGNSRSSVSG